MTQTPKTKSQLKHIIAQHNRACLDHLKQQHAALAALLRNGLECGVFDGAPEYRADVKQALAAAEKGS